MNEEIAYGRILRIYNALHNIQKDLPIADMTTPWADVFFDVFDSKRKLEDALLTLRQMHKPHDLTGGSPTPPQTKKWKKDS